MKELINQAGTYAGELIISGVALLIRAIEKKLIIRKARRDWLKGETYTKIEKNKTGQK